jgi:4a-hydroxytetrahydrobiopterin dehydratase
MSNICDLKCEACRTGVPQLEKDEISQLLQDVPEWELKETEGGNRIFRRFKFKNFGEALDFTDRVGAIAEENGHHPSILTQWGSVKVTYWTHKIGGLHKSDFIMAAKTDKLYGGES